MSHDVDVVGALCFTRHPPFAPCFGFPPGVEGFPDDEPLQQVGFVGTGCLLVQRRVFDVVQYPWFEHPLPGTGEDVLFCDKLRAAGIPVYLDQGIEVGHISVQPVASREAYLFEKFPPPGRIEQPKRSARFVETLNRNHEAALLRALADS